MSETTEKAQERERVLREGFELFEKMEARVFDELSDILPNWKDLKITDYFRLGFAQGYLEGYRKTKGETRPETKERQPMPEILPGYLVTYNNEEWAVTKKDHRGCLEIYRDRQRIAGVDPKYAMRIWDEDGIPIWSKE